MLRENDRVKQKPKDDGKKSEKDEDA